MHLREIKTVKERRKVVEEALDVSLENIGTFSLDEEQAGSKNCENMIGVAQVPMGIAGPLEVHGAKVNGSKYVPLATTEGALIASVSRGCKAVSLSGGVSALTYRSGQTRGPVFEVNSLEELKKLYDWIENNQDKLQAEAEKTSRHLKLKNAMAKGVGRYLYVRFLFQ